MYTFPNEDRTEVCSMLIKLDHHQVPELGRRTLVGENTANIECYIANESRGGRVLDGLWMQSTVPPTSVT